MLSEAEIRAAWETCKWQDLDVLAHNFPEQMRFRFAHAVEAALRAQADAQPIYQWQCNPDGSWKDVDEAEYKLIGTKYRRIVYTHPAPEAAQALSAQD